jgi:NAD(P)-dependent dehydrogenase (short-subunit alcohol dehydrogenase family)
MTGILEEQSALVTGSGGGIGRATALAFAREGARVAVWLCSDQAATSPVPPMDGHLNPDPPRADQHCC